MSTFQWFFYVDFSDLNLDQGQKSCGAVELEKQR